jgi:sec-independent protein translocase protein TatC
MRWRNRADEPAEMPFLDHLEELRWRIIWSLLALVVGAVVGFGLVTYFNVLHWLIRPVEPYLHGGKLNYLSPSDPFFLTLRLGLTVGGLLAAPVVVYQIWAFLAPALHPHERRAIVPAFYLGLLLFLAGVALAYFAALPETLRFMMSFQQESMAPMITAGPYLGFVVKLLVAFGVVFELPVVMLVLASMGLVNARMLRKQRRFAIVIATVLAAVITPGDMVMLTIFIMIPLIFLYELSIWLTAWVERRRRNAAVREELAQA